MPQVEDAPPPRLAHVLRALRRLRGKRSAEVAQALNLPLRSYEHFESAAGRLNVQRVLAFAEVVDSDGFAILASLWIGSPRFAVRCADNKLMTILIMALQDFDAAAGEAMATLDARTLIQAFEQTFSELRDEARRRASEGWLQDHASRLARRADES